MTLDEIRLLVVKADKNAGHYESAFEDENYTVWREYEMLGTMADDGHCEGWRFQIDRFTRAEDDDIAKAIYDTLAGDDRVAFEYLVDYEKDTRYIHHIFDCEGY